MVSPRALAVLRLSTSSNFVGRSTGRSAGLAPFRSLSTKTAARRHPNWHPIPPARRTSAPSFPANPLL